MGNVTTFEVPCLSTHFHSLNEVEHGVVDALSRDVAESLCMSQRKVVHWVNVIGCVAAQELLLTLIGTFVD